MLLYLSAFLGKSVYKIEKKNETERSFGVIIQAAVIFRKSWKYFGRDLFLFCKLVAQRTTRF